MKTLIKILIILLVALQCTQSIAQATKPGAKLSGTILDEKGATMPFATISLLKAKDSSLVKGAITNETGTYTFNRVTPGNYVISVSVMGYLKSKSNVIAIMNNDVIVPAIKLSTGTKTLKEVTITSTKPLIERQSDRMVMNVENSPLAAGNSAMEILERAPGVSIDKDDNISLKGKQGVTVMINDKLTYLSSAQLATLLRSTDGTTIQSIEIITNPSAKYDAAGNSGIINIKLKKNKQSGTNGSITTGVAYGSRWKDNTSVTINHKEGKLNAFGTFSHNDNTHDHNLDIKRVVTDSVGGKTYFNQFSSLPNTNHNNSYRFGADYDMTSKNTVGFLVSGYSNTEYDGNNNTTYIGNQPTVINSYQNTTSAINQSYKNFALNLNDRLQLDTSGQTLGIDLDYSKFNNNSNAQYTTNFFNPDGSVMMIPSLLRNQTPSVITIHTAKADYALPITKTLKLEAGVKFSGVKTDNDLEAQQQVSGTYVNDPTLTNRFVYDEKIDAGYISFDKTFKNTTVKAGLRAEYTSSMGDLVTTDSVVSRSYLNFFPSFFINHTFNDKNELGFTYSRRIDRPSYGDLNPFVYYLDQYTYEKGNPFLNPQYTNSFELNYTYNKTINVSLGYSRTTDAMTQVLLTDPASKATFETNINLQTQNNYSININSPYTITKWWTGNINGTAFYMGFKSDGLLGANLNDGKVAYQIKATQTFALAKGYKAEFMTNYLSSLVDGLFYVKPQYSNDIGFSHSFSDKKANIKLSMSDIFNTRRNDVNENYQSTDLQIMQKNESRITRLTFTYNFGNNKIKGNQHQTGADDLNGRVKGSN